MIQVLKHKIMDLQNECLPFWFQRRPFKKRKNDYYFLMLRKINTLDRKLQNIEDLFSFYFDGNCGNFFQCNKTQNYNLPKFYDSIHSLIDLANKIKEEIACKNCNLSQNNSSQIHDKIHLLESELQKFSMLLGQIKNSELNKLRINNGQASKCDKTQKNCLEERADTNPCKKHSGLCEKQSGCDRGHTNDNFRNKFNRNGFNNDSDSYYAQVSRNQYGRHPPTRPTGNGDQGKGCNSTSRGKNRNRYFSQYHSYNYTNSKIPPKRPIPNKSFTLCPCCESTNVINGSVEERPFKHRTFGPSRSASQCSCDSCECNNPRRGCDTNFISNKSPEVNNVNISDYSDEQFPSKNMTKKRKNKAKHNNIYCKENIKKPLIGERDLNHKTYYLTKDTSLESVYKPTRHEYSEDESINSPAELKTQERPSSKLIIMKHNKKSNKVNSKQLLNKISNESRVSFNRSNVFEQYEKPKGQINYQRHKQYPNNNQRLQRNSEPKPSKTKIIFSDQDVIFVNKGRKKKANSNSNIYFLYSDSNDENKDLKIEKNLDKQVPKRMDFSLNDKDLEHDKSDAHFQVKCHKVNNVDKLNNSSAYYGNSNTMYENQSFQTGHFKDISKNKSKVLHCKHDNTALNKKKCFRQLKDDGPAVRECIPTLPMTNNNAKYRDNNSSGNNSRSSSYNVYVCDKNNCIKQTKHEKLVLIVKSSESLSPKQKRESKNRKILLVQNPNGHLVVRSNELNQTRIPGTSPINKHHKRKVARTEVVEAANPHPAQHNQNNKENQEDIRLADQRKNGSHSSTRKNENIYNNNNMEIFRAGIEQEGVLFKNKELNLKNIHTENINKDSFSNKRESYTQDSHIYREENSMNISSEISPYRVVQNDARLDIIEPQGKPTTSSIDRNTYVESKYVPEMKNTKINQQDYEHINDKNSKAPKEQLESPKSGNSYYGKLKNNSPLGSIDREYGENKYINELDLQTPPNELRRKDYKGADDKDKVARTVQPKLVDTSKGKSEPELPNKAANDAKTVETPKSRDIDNNDYVKVKNQSDIAVESAENEKGFDVKHKNSRITNVLPLNKLYLDIQLKDKPSYQPVGYKRYLYTNKASHKNLSSKKNPTYSAQPKNVKRSKINNIRQSTSVLPVKIKNKNRLCPEISCYNGGYPARLKRILKKTDSTNFSSEVINLVRKSLELSKYPYQCENKLTTSDSNTESVLFDDYQKMFISALTSDSSSFSLVNWRKIATKLKEEKCNCISQTD